MKTENEARECWCPFARVASVSNMPDGCCGMASANRFTRVDDECGCIASSCAAWRWAGMLTAKGKKVTSDEAKEAARSGCYEVDELPLGYCGLAGKP